MAKVSIGLRGWRFDEPDVFDANGDLRPLDEMPDDVATRLARLSALVGAPCDACWLIHGDDNLQACNVARIVYGEPMAEVVLCTTHEVDFLYWYREADGHTYRGDDELQDRFHEWFADGGRAPDTYEGIDHVDTAPADLPDPDVDPDKLTIDQPEEDKHRIDLRDVDLDTDYPS